MGNMSLQDNINPSHYKGVCECPGCAAPIEAITLTEKYNFCVGNALKYILRAGKKIDFNMSKEGKRAEDLKKAIWYISREIENIEKGGYDGKTEIVEDTGSGDQSGGGPQASGEKVSEYDFSSAYARGPSFSVTYTEPYCPTIRFGEGAGPAIGRGDDDTYRTFPGGNGMNNLTPGATTTYNYGTYWAGTASGWDIMINQMKKDAK